MRISHTPFGASLGCSKIQSVYHIKWKEASGRTGESPTHRVYQSAKNDTLMAVWMDVTQ